MPVFMRASSSAYLLMVANGDEGGADMHFRLSASPQAARGLRGKAES